jgi:esterase/lipase
MSEKQFGVLLLHGFVSTPENFHDQVPHLEALNLPCLTPTLTGHGAETPEAIIGVDWKKTEHSIFPDCEREAVNQSGFEYIQGRSK